MHFSGLFIGYSQRGVYKTVNGGKTWEYVSTMPEGFRYNSKLIMKNSLEGWFRSINDQENEIYVFHTIDGGYNWEAIKVWKNFPNRIFALKDSIIAADTRSAAVSSDGIHWEKKKQALVWDHPDFAPVIKILKDSYLNRLLMDYLFLNEQ